MMSPAEDRVARERDLEAREKDFETKAGEEGKRLFLERLLKYPGRSPEATTSAMRYFKKLESRIKKSREEAISVRGQGNRFRWHKAILAFPPDTLALITVWCIVEKLARPRSLDDASQRGASFSSFDETPSEQELLREIERTLYLEHFASWLRSQESSSAERDQRWINRARSARERKRRFEFSERDYSEWSSIAKDTWFYLAQLLVYHAKDVRLIKAEGKRQKTVTLEERAFTLIEAVAPPYYKPMIAKPVPWGRLRGGGYRWVPHDLDFVKHWGNPSIVEALKTAKLDRVYNVVNVLQETPWRINEWIAGVAKEIKRRRINCPGVPTPGEVRAAKAQWQRLKVKAESSDNATDWSEALGARSRFERLRMKRFVERKLAKDRLEMSEELIREDADFYFPYQLDFRGRVYAVPHCFNPQSDDIGRALLRFAVGKPLGNRGPFWLAVHVANQWGHRCGKMSFRKREKWVQENRRRIEFVVQHPLHDSNLRWWTDAKKPWRFLAACKEWAQYLKEGARFTSYLPIAVDGSCNGFQHLSAMLLDRHGCEATNILPGKAPHDIYSQVAAKLKSRVETDVSTSPLSDRGLARKWLEVGIDRDVTKMPTMITPYGAGRDTKQKELEEVLDKRRRTLHSRMSTSTVRNMAKYLIDPLDECIDETCHAHQRVEQWFKNVARESAGSDVYKLVEELLATELHVTGPKRKLKTAVWQKLGKSSRGSGQITVAAAERLQKRLLPLVRRCLAHEVCRVQDKRLTRVARALVGKYIFLWVREEFMAGINSTARKYCDRDIRKKGFETGMKLVFSKRAQAKGHFQRLVRLISQNAHVSKNEASRLADDLVSLLRACKAKICRDSRVGAFLRSWQHRDLVGLAPGRPVRWTSPVGFPIVQAEWLYRNREVGSKAYGGKYTEQDTSKRLGIDRNAQARGITPNFVHSCDAAHMMLTVEALRKPTRQVVARRRRRGEDQGLKHFAVIHDSYAVHACDIERLNHALRQTFARLYRGDILKHFWEELKRTNPDIPRLAERPPPSRGEGMHVDAVLRSKYFFN